jgi:predicted Rossmann fold flavoprotein
MSHQFEVIVVGAGAAGFLAATRAAERGRRTLLLEKNRKPGVKILMSGGTRCNLTHATDARGIVEAFGRRQGPFLYSALAALGPDSLVQLIESEGVRTKVEPGGKIFPVSNRAGDVLEALQRRLKRSGATLWLDAAVKGVERLRENGSHRFRIRLADRELLAESVVVTVGGQSYPGCGTCGDGYGWAKSFGHKVIPPRPALAPLTSPASWVHSLRGVTIADVTVRIENAEDKRDPTVGTKRRREEETTSCRGSFLFTHFGLSGPAPMNLSRVVTARPNSRHWQAVCDFAPQRRDGELSEALTAAGAEGRNRSVVALMGQWLPRRLAEALLDQSQVPTERRMSELTKRERAAIVDAIKRTAIPIDGTLGFKKAEVTAGGVSLDEIESRTMQSKLIEGLYFAGEILDLDGPIGGYNFQAAFSTGWLAGEWA